MDTEPATVPRPLGTAPQSDPDPGLLRASWHRIRGRILGGFVVVLPLLITFWVMYWTYTFLERRVIDPLSQVVLWKVSARQPDAELPFWFETYAAPPIAISIALGLLYCLGFFAHTRLRRVVDWTLMRVPVISVVYKGVRQVLQTLDKQPGQSRPQRVVLIPFPHPGMRVPAFVTGSCRDLETQKTILCVYVPTTPVPTSGYMLLVPQDDVIELNWSPEQALQTIVSGGLTVPPEVRYYKNSPDTKSLA